MKPESSKSRIPVNVTACLLTAVATFALGRMTSSNPVATIADHFRTKAQSENGSAGNALFQEGKPDQIDKGSDVLAGTFGRRADSLKEVLGDRPLELYLKNLLQQDDEENRMLGFLRLLDTLDTPEDLRMALEVFSTGEFRRSRSTEQSMLLQKWAKLDAKAAATYAGELGDWSRFTAMNAVLRTWLKSDSEAAIAWAQKNGASEQDQRRRDEGNWAIATMIEPLAQQSLGRALQVAANQPVSRARGRMIDTLIDELVSQRGEESARNSIIDLPDDPFRAGMAARLASKSAESNPSATAAWAWSLPVGDTRQRAMAEAIAQWSEKDAVAAGNYLLQLGGSPELDGARQRYAGEVLKQDPEGALSWASAITDEKQRQDTTQWALRNWMKRDQPAAQAWASAHGMAISSDPARMQSTRQPIRQ